jgi:hypothetical protein
MSRRIRPTRTEVAERKYSSPSTAPNGSSRTVDHWTIVTEREVWPEYTEDNGKPGTYSGRVYRITSRYISNRAEYRGQYVDMSSSPW